MFASCGLERDVAVWAANSSRRIGSLVGHTASVSHVCLDERLNQVFTLAADRVIKVWDLRTHRCLQTLAEDDWARKDTSAPNCIVYDGSRRRLVSAQHHPYIWHHKMTSLDRTGHREPLKCGWRGGLLGCCWYC
jgi:WD40 repeat protein